MSEQKYKFVDVTGKCFGSFARIEDSTDYHKMVAVLLMHNEFGVGDMLSFRDDLIEDGFVWGKEKEIQQEQLLYANALWLICEGDFVR